MPEFVKDVEELRQRAIRHIEEGPVTEGYKVDKDQAIRILNEALATEIVCVLRYMHHYFMATGLHGKSVADEFKEHADAERDHADQIAERIQQLGGKPDYNPASLVQRSVSQYIEGETLADMIREDLIAERVVIEVYADMIRFFGDKDPTTRVMLEGILKDEEEHAADLADLLYIVDPQTGETEGQDPGTHPLSMHPEHQGREPQPQQRQGGRREQRQEGNVAQQRNQGPGPEASEPFAGRGTAVPAGAAGARGTGEQRGSANQAQSEARPSRSTGRERPADRSVPPAHAPGTTGRPTRQRGSEVEPFEEPAAEADEGAQGGATRAVRVTRPTRKKRVA